MKSIKQLQKYIDSTYADSLGLNPDASYVNGSPLRPVVPLDTAENSLFVIGAYPSARFRRIENLNDVPVADNLGPFEPERWFDGARVREQKSAIELESSFLDPMGGISRTNCWITDLVKVFLFKKGHRRKYKHLGVDSPLGYERERFHELGVLSLSFLEIELVLAKPCLVVTLGSEVAGVLRGVRSSRAQTALLVPEETELSIGSATVPTMHCPHPGLLMRSERKWIDRFQQEFLPALRRAWERCAD